MWFESLENFTTWGSLNISSYYQCIWTKFYPHFLTISVVDDRCGSNRKFHHVKVVTITTHIPHVYGPISTLRPPNFPISHPHRENLQKNLFPPVPEVPTRPDFNGATVDAPLMACHLKLISKPCKIPRFAPRSSLKLFDDSRYLQRNYR